MARASASSSPGDDRQARRAGLDQSERITFGARGQHEYVHGRQQGRHVAACAEPSDQWTQPEPIGLCFEPAAELTIAGNDQCHRLATFGERFQRAQDPMLLLGFVEPAYRAEDHGSDRQAERLPERSAGLVAARREAAQVDSVADHDGLPSGHHAVRHEALPGGVAHADGVVGGHQRQPEQLLAPGLQVARTHAVPRVQHRAQPQSD
jgi:hypothetical protein